VNESPVDCHSEEHSGEELLYFRVNPWLFLPFDPRSSAQIRGEN